MKLTEEELAAKLKENPDLKVDDTFNRALAFTTSYEKPTKYRSRRTIYNGISFASKKEADHAQMLDMAIQAGAVKYWLRQVPFQLSETRYFADFQVFYPDGSVRYFDVKGYDTPLSKLKRKQVKALYGVTIELV